jgi:hypothetical protein
MRGLFTALMLVSGPVGAVEVYVNDVNVEGLTNQSFEKVTVRLDEKGNVHIDAPGYTVKRVTMAPPKETQPAGTITQKYFLVTEQTTPGATEYDIDVFINGRLLRTLGSSEPQLVTEVTRELKPGKNSIILQARKQSESKERPRSTAKTNVFRVIIGEGGARNDQVVLDKQLITFTRTAAETNDVTQEFTITTR